MNKYTLREAATIANNADAVERDLNDARTGARYTFRPLLPVNDPICEHCKQVPEAHIVSNGIMFCPEWALRERWGR